MSLSQSIKATSRKIKHHVRFNFKKYERQTVAFIKKNLVMVIALVAAIATSCIIPIDKEYVGYFDFKTLTCLFLTLAVICALKNIRFFSIVAEKIVMMTGNLRGLALTLVYITFIGSMLIANDMALITFLPLGYFALSRTHNEKHMAYVFILQNISANLGGMLTPFGNPQNLYLYTAFKIPTGEFMGIMLKPFILAIAMLTAACFLLKREPLVLEKQNIERMDPKRVALYLALFTYSIFIVFRVIPYWTGLILIPGLLLIVDRKALKNVDYALLFTFAFFFIFAGNVSRMDAISTLLQGLLEKSTLLVSELSCQFISNVPSAILLSKFTANYQELLLGVNIGGTGTLISSLASLITFNNFKMMYPGHLKEYLLKFTILNVIFLGTQTLAAYFIFI